MKQIGPYIVREELARGGMGVVYRVHDPRADRDVALKLLHGYEEHEAEELERFEREAQATAQIRHPGVVAVHAFGWEHGKPYLAMDLVEGESLKQRLRLGPLPEVEATSLMEKVARALEAAHKVGVLHRDLKPENILLRGDTGEPILTDFGLAKVAGRQSLTASGTALGTPAYMAPEQALGDRAAVGERTDVYGLGATLYELLTGRPPFEGATAIAIMARAIEEEPTPPRALRADLDPGLEAIVLRCLAKDPEKRFQSVGALADALADFLRGGGVGPRRDRESRALVLGVAAVLTLGAALWVGLWGSGTGTVEPPGPPPLPAKRAVVPRPAPEAEVVAEPVPTEPFRLTAYGWRRLEREEFLEAKRAFEGVLEQDPGSSRARLGLARVWKEWGDNVAGLEVLADVPRADRDPEVLELRAALLTEEFQHQAALEACDQALALDGDRAQGYAARAQAYVHMGERSFAMLQFDEALLRADPERAPALRALILAHKALALDAGFAAESLIIAKQALDLDEDCAEARFAHAFASYRLEDLRGALADLDYVLERNPRSARFRALRGVCMLAMGRLNDAIADQGEALKLWPGYPAALHYRSEALRKRAAADGATPDSAARDLAAAEEAAHQAIASCERFGPGYGDLARTRAALGDQKGRLAALKDGARVLPANANMQMAYGNAVYEQGELQVREVLELLKTDKAAAEARFEEVSHILRESERAVLKALESSPRRRDSYELWSKLRFLLQDPAGELRALEQGVEMVPLDPRMWNALGELQRRRKSWEEAAESFYKASKLDAKSPGYLNRLAEALTRQKKHEDAASVLHQATRLPSAGFSSWFELGKALLELERYGEAVKPLARARNLTQGRKEEVSFFLGEAFWGEGKPLKAERHYELYLTKAKSKAHIKRSKERVAEAKQIRER